MPISQLWRNSCARRPLGSAFLINSATSTLGTLEILKRKENWEVGICEIVIDPDEHSRKKLAIEKHNAANDTDSEEAMVIKYNSPTVSCKSLSRENAILEGTSAAERRSELK